MNCKSFALPITLIVGLSLCAAIEGSGQSRVGFTSPYGLTPPSAGVSSVPLGGPYHFGDWAARSTAGEILLDSSQAPASLTLDTGLLAAPGIGHGGLTWVQSAGSGTVSFSYTISGSGAGDFVWFDNGSSNPAQFGVQPSAYLGQITGLVSSPTAISFSVQAGDYFGFSVGADEMPPELFYQRAITISSFSAPVPEPSALALACFGVTLLALKRRV